ncbi:MAG: CUAEP/CCAEP-tail radical SAM (seleno)protein [Myxococcales bacterium]
MREPGAICLVSCYELGHAPAGIAMPLAFLERAGFRPSVVDLAVEPIDARLERARLVLISVPMHTALRLGLRLLDRLRELNPGARVVFHGLYAQANRELLLARGAEAVLAGEHEEALVSLCAGDTGAPVGPVLAKLDFPVPNHRPLPPLEAYGKLDLGNGETRLVASTEASRGCRHLCRHCPVTPVYRGRFFVVPREVVLEDIERQLARGARHVTFGDPDFWNGPGHADAIVRELHRRHPEVSWDATIKIEHLLSHRERLGSLAQDGCAFITTAVESLSDLVLAQLAKGHTARDVETAFDLCDAASLPLRPTFVAFTPWTTAADVARMLAFVRRRGLGEIVDPVQYTLRLLIPPGSALLELPIPSLGPLREETLSYEWRHPDPRLDALQHQLRALVERGGPDRGELFETVCAATEAALGLALPSAPGPKRRKHIPSLTESWFC